VALEPNRPITSAGIVRNARIPAATSLAHEISQMVRAHGVHAWESEELNEPDAGERVAQSDLLITLGGDGTILQAARATAGHRTLILGVNLGRIGFLTETEPDAWQEVIPRVLQGAYWIEERMMLHAAARRGTELLAQGEALNDVVVGQGALSRVVRLEVYADGELLTSYVTDALIVATPTGSTAYALAAGGPIMPPQQRNILLVPVAPHLSLDRAVVLAEGVQVQVVVRGRSPAALTLDGQRMVALATGDVVQAGASPHAARFARVRERDYFYRTLMGRLVPRERDETCE
jgi:NAD+ kinase